MRLPILVFTILPMAASAQLLTFGVQGGVPAQTPLGRTDQMPFTLGPTLGVHIAGGLSLETGLLYDRIGRRSESATFLTTGEVTLGAVTVGSITTHGYALEVPLLARYRFRGIRGNWRPFLSAGPVLRHTSVRTEQLFSILGGSSLVTNSLSVVNSRIAQWNLDPAAGAGLDVRAGRFHLEPEVRYSYWAAGKNGPIRKNQVNFLMGCRF